MTASPNRHYIPAIDHLRAYAATLIVFYHGVQVISAFEIHDRMFRPADWVYSDNPFFALILEGHTAVALFMVLSGFIFTYGATEHRINYKDFLINRLLRIYPLYFVLIAFGLAIYPDNFSTSGLVQTVLPLANVPGSLDLGPISAMFWTIAVEFQFYLIFPLLLQLCRGGGRERVLALIGLMILLRILGVALEANPRDLSYWNLIGRLDQFLAGMVTAVIAEQMRRPRQPVWALLATTAAMLSVIFAFHKAGGWPIVAWWKVLWPTVEGLGWAAVILCYFWWADVMWGRLSKALCWLGSISYSTYLTHFCIIFALTRFRGPLAFADDPYLNAFLNTALVVFPLTSLVSALTYSFIERPFLALRRRYVTAVEGEHNGSRLLRPMPSPSQRPLDGA